MLRHRLESQMIRFFIRYFFIVAVDVDDVCSVTPVIAPLFPPPLKLHLATSEL